MTEIQTTTAFDYGRLDGETWKVVQDATDTIHQLRGQSVILIGEQLAAVKARLKHGLYGEWLDKEFAWSERTALSFVQVFEQFGKSANFAEVSRNIGKSAAYLLAAPSTPQEARDEAMAVAAVGERVTHQKAKEIVRRHKQAPYAPNGDPRATSLWDEQQRPLSKLQKIRRLWDEKAKEAAEQLLNRDQLEVLKSAWSEATEEQRAEFLDWAGIEQKKEPQQQVGDFAGAPPLPNGAELGTRLKAYRAAKKVGQVELSILLGCNQGTLSRVESGIHTPKPQLLARMEEMLAAWEGMQSAAS